MVEWLHQGRGCSSPTGMPQGMSVHVHVFDFVKVFGHTGFNLSADGSTDHEVCIVAILLT